MNVLLTGVSGFVGRELGSCLAKRGIELVASTRDASQAEASSGLVYVGEINGKTDWKACLGRVSVVIHAAARAHVLKEVASNPLIAFRETNVEGTLKLAQQALEAGVKRFVFISSIGVNGASTSFEPFSEASKPAPRADYAVSKFEAEQGLWRLVEGTEMDLVVIRPPLVYAAHAPGNFARLLRLVNSGMPLPFGLVDNQRSMISLQNLVDFIRICIEHPAAANQTFLVSDGTEVSTAKMIQLLAAGMERKANLLPVPVGFMRLVAKLLGKQNIFEQLCGSLVINSSKARELLGWQPPFDVHDALLQVGKEYNKK